MTTIVCKSTLSQQCLWNIGNSLLVNVHVLTYMATLEDLEKAGVVSRAMPRVKPAIREIWAYSNVVTWIKTVLPGLEAMPRHPGETPLRPQLQLVILFESFIRGGDMFEGEEFWKMRPRDADVYEFRTDDLRCFGWFCEPRRLILTAIDTMERSHTHNLHNAYRDEVIRKRDALDLAPKLVVGGEPGDVL